MKSKLILTILIISLAASFSGCNASDTIDETKQNIEGTIDEAGDSIKDAGDTVTNEYDEEMMNLDKEGLIQKIESKGFKVSEITDDEGDIYGNYKFSVPKDELLVNDQRIALYVYPNKEELDKDVRNIENNDYLVDGTKINEANPPHIYRSGKLMVVYSGSNTEINNLLMDIFKSKIK